MIAVTSISIRAAEGVSPATWTSVLAGRVDPKASAWARVLRDNQGENARQSG